MSIFAAILLALVAGITEILPVSGTGHFYIVERVLGLSLSPADRLILLSALYLGTALSLLLFYRRQMGRMLAELPGILNRRPPQGHRRGNLFPRRQLLLLSISALPMAGALLLQGPANRITGGDFVLLFTAGAQTVSGLLLYFATRGARERKDLQSMTLSGGLLIGLSQLPAVFPGLSRSGLTLSMGLLLGFDGPAALEYSGLLGIPAFLSAGIFHWIAAGKTGEIITVPVSMRIVVFCLTAVTGFLTLHGLTNRLKTKKPTGFAFWCWGAAIICLVLFLITV